MPLHVRLRKDHYPHDERPPRLDDHVVLSGGLEVGSFHRIGSGPSEGRWSWGTGLGAATASFVATGYATSPEECRTYIGTAFRRMLARAELRERPDAQPGPPRREQVIDGPAGPLRPYDRGKDGGGFVSPRQTNGTSRRSISRTDPRPCQAVPK